MKPDSVGGDQTASDVIQSGQRCVALSGTCYGIHFRIEVPNISIADSLAECLRPWADLRQASSDLKNPLSNGRKVLLFSVAETGRTENGAFYSATGESSPHFDSLACKDLSLRPFLDRFECELQHAIACEPSEYVFVHAAVVAFDSIGVVLPGCSYTGKTTLAWELVRAGARYLSDEFAVVASDGCIHAFPRRPRVRQAHDPEPLRPSIAAAAHASDYVDRYVVLSTTFSPRAPWRPMPMTRAEVLVELIKHSVKARIEPGRVMQNLGASARRAVGFRSARGDAAEVVESIRDLAGGAHGFAHSSPAVLSMDQHELPA